MDLALTHIFAESTQASFLAEVGDENLAFSPHRRMEGVRTKTDLKSFAKRAQPGSAVLLAQSLLVPFARGGMISKFDISGGTHVPYSPTYDYFRYVTLPALARTGVFAAPSIESAAYSSRGSGEISIEIEPSALEPFNFSEPGLPRSVRCCIVTSELSESVGKRALTHVESLSRRDGIKIKSEFVKLRSAEPGAAVAFGAALDHGFGGAQAFGEKGKRVEEVVEEAYYAFVFWLNSGAGVDEYLADQLVIPGVLSGKPCSFTTSRITKTLQTTAWVIKQFMPAKITILGSEGEPGEVRINADL